MLTDTLAKLPHWVTFAVLGLSAAGCIYAILAPAKPDPQRGVAVGCLLFVVFLLILAMILFAIGVLFDVPWLRQAITASWMFAIGFTLLSLLQGLVQKAIARMRDR